MTDLTPTVDCPERLYQLLEQCLSEHRAQGLLKLLRRNLLVGETLAVFHDRELKASVTAVRYMLAAEGGSIPVVVFWHRHRHNLVHCDVAHAVNDLKLGTAKQRQVLLLRMQFSLYALALRSD